MWKSDGGGGIAGKEFWGGIFFGENNNNNIMLKLYNFVYIFGTDLKVCHKNWTREWSIFIVMLTGTDNSIIFSWNHFHEKFSWDWFHEKNIIVVHSFISSVS